MFDFAAREVPGSFVLEEKQAIWRMVSHDRFVYILFGVSLIGVGMLSHTGNNVSMDTFGPIADNAGGLAEMAELEKEDD